MLAASAPFGTMQKKASPVLGGQRVFVSEAMGKLQVAIVIHVVSTYNTTNHCNILSL